MTREEAIEKLELMRQKVDEETYRALILAIKALEQNESAEEWYKLFVKKLDEQQPRENKSIMNDTELGKAIRHIKTRADAWAVKVLTDALRDISERLDKALSQEPKSGKWIEQEGWDGDVYYECSVCGEAFCLIDGTPTDNMYNFCPNCGARMVEPQERSE